jgi:hypothetical protein
LRLTPGLRASGVLILKHEKPYGGKTPEVNDLLPLSLTLQDFSHFRRPLQDFRCFETLGGTATNINVSLLILRSMVYDFFGSLGFDSSEFLCISHFETLEAHFPECLDRVPPIPLKINESCLLWGFSLVL